MQDSLIDQGLNLMLFGMGTVFVFLTLLVFATTLMSRLVTRFAPEAAPLASSPQVSTATSPNVDSKTVRIIEKAIAAHRQSHD